MSGPDRDRPAPGRGRARGRGAASGPGIAPVPVRWHPTADEALPGLARDRILDAAEAAIAARGEFRIVLAGGSTPRAAYRLLGQARTDWSAWHVYFGDERCLPAGDPQRNDTMAREEWLDRVPIPSTQRHPFEAERGPQQAASRYAETLRGVGDFDLVLLGLGEDGHTASLFPGRELGVQPGSPDAMPVVDAPKPPPDRVTLSAARLSRSRAVLFLVSGDGKREALQRWQRGEAIPAAAIRPPGGVDVLVEASLLEARAVDPRP